MRSLALFPFLFACSGSDDETTTPPAASCDDLTAAPLGQVPVGDWPDGFPEALADYNSLGGRYETTGSGDCGDAETIAVKLVPRSQEELYIVTEPWPAASVLKCGCVTDPEYGDDTEYPIAAQIPDFEFFIESFGDPGLDNQNVVGSGALFEASSPLSVRQCGTKNVDPVLGSAYEQFTTLLRIDQDGVLSGALTLVKTDGTNEVCELTDWNLIQGL